MTSVRPPQAEEAVFSHSLANSSTSTSSGASLRSWTSSEERAAGIDGLELRVVADQQHLRPSLGREACS